MDTIAQVFGTSGWENKVTLYIPSTTDSNVLLSAQAAENAANRAKRFMARTFGGATTLRAEGSWLSGDVLIEESVTLVYSFASVLTEDDLHKVKVYCEALKTELKQDAIAVEVNGELIFI
jgi:hypothetical protein